MQEDLTSIQDIAIDKWTGSMYVYELAEVVRNLAMREMEKGLSTGEKQMYTRAKKILASEFMYALDKDADGAEEYLDGLLEDNFGGVKATA